MADLDTLIAELEQASEGSRDLDARVALAAGWLRKFGDDGRTYWKHGDDSWLAISDGGPDFYPTTSIDAALTLVPEGFVWGVGTDIDEGPSAVLTRYPADYKTGDGFEYHEHTTAATPPLALCIAALKARRG